LQTEELISVIVTLRKNLDPSDNERKGSVIFARCNTFQTIIKYFNKKGMDNGHRLPMSGRYNVRLLSMSSCMEI